MIGQNLSPIQTLQKKIDEHQMLAKECAQHKNAMHEGMLKMHDSQKHHEQKVREFTEALITLGVSLDNDGGCGCQCGM